MEQFRKAARAPGGKRGGRGGAGGADSNKVLLEWGLATIENLSKQAGRRARSVRPFTRVILFTRLICALCIERRL